MKSSRHRRDSCPSDEVVGSFFSIFEAIRAQAYLRAALSAQPRWFDGTTAVVVLVVDGILTIGWCGDSRAVLGRKAKGSKQWTAFELSHDHKPTNPREHKRILQLGGMVGRSLKEAQSGKAYQRAGGCVEINQ